MIGPYSEIDVAALGAPPVLPDFEYEAERAAMLAAFAQSMGVDAGALYLSNPMVKLIEVALERARAVHALNTARLQALFLPFATGAMLDHIGATYHRVQRLDGEEDADYLARILVGPDVWSTAGAGDAYWFHAKSAHPEVKDVAVLSHDDDAAIPRGDVHVYVLARDGVPNADVLAAVRAAVADKEAAAKRRDLGAHVQVFPARLRSYRVAATLHPMRGPDAAAGLAEAVRRLEAYAAGAAVLNRSVSRSGIAAALHLSGVVEWVALTEPAGVLEEDTRIAVDPREVAMMTDHAISLG